MSPVELSKVLTLTGFGSAGSLKLNLFVGQPVRAAAQVPHMQKDKQSASCNVVQQEGRVILEGDIGGWQTKNLSFWLVKWPNSMCSKPNLRMHSR